MGVGLVVLLTCSIEIPLLNANSVDPDQTPRSVESDLGLHCLPMSLIWDIWHKWVNSLSKIFLKQRNIKEASVFKFTSPKSSPVLTRNSILKRAHVFAC